MIIFSPAMNATLLTEHFLSSTSGVKLQRIKSGFMADNDWNLLVRAMDSLYDASIHINDSAELTIDDIREEVGTPKRQGVELAIIDYFNPIKREEGDVYGKNDMKETVFSLKKIAQDLNISVMAIFQFLGTAKGMGLRLSDLKKYGITADALDTAIFINRQSKPYICHPEEYACGSRYIAEISVLKPKKNIKTKFSFYSGLLKFKYKSKIHAQPSPT
jgi:replicative DNA helicase